MIGLIHLVWTPLGREPLREFVRSYRAHAAGAEHELVIVLNGPAPSPSGSPGGSPGSASGARTRARGVDRHGVDRHGVDQHGVDHGDEDVREALLAELEGVPYRLIVLERPVLDLAAYGLAARQLSHERLCFLNSYSVVLADDWLACLADALGQPLAGIAGTTGSWESQAEWVRGRARYWPYQLLRAPAARRDYRRFPNPHIRTTGFIAGRDLIIGLGLERAGDKRDTYLLESGHDSITSQVLARGLRALVAGRDGNVYDLDDWPRAGTYRSGGQRNLLVADRRTRDWECASARLRGRLSRDAWGNSRA